MELKSIKCITTTGILIALYVVLEAFVSIKIPGIVTISFAFVPLAAIGMLFGPTVSVLAAILCDVIGAAMSGYPLVFWYTLIAMLEALIYGFFLYGFKPEKNLKQQLKIIISRTIVILVVNILLNTTANYLCGYLSTDVPLYIAIGTRVLKNVLELPIDCLVLYSVLIPAKIAYVKLKKQAA